MSLLVLSASDVARITAKFTPDELVNLMATVFHKLSLPEDGIHQPQRVGVPLANHTSLFMPSRMPLFGTAMKAVSVPTSTAPEGIRDRGLPASTIVLDDETGAVKAIVNARKLTALRNAAGALTASSIHYPCSL